jgi:hypothetical protein
MNPRTAMKHATRRLFLGVMTMKCSILFVSLVCIAGAFGQTNSSFYASTTGDDSNPGTQTAPWRTVQHAAARRPQRRWRSDSRVEIIAS